MKYSAQYQVLPATFHVTKYRGKSISFGTVQYKFQSAYVDTSRRDRDLFPVWN